MTVNRFKALPKAKKTCGGVYSTALEFGIIVAIRQR
jgi:hypothetical protein